MEHALRWAVVGVGIAGRARARAIASDPGCRLVAVYRGRFAGETGAPSAASLEEAIAAADAVAIASPTEAHEAQVEAALRAGRHVVVEYPTATSAAGAERLLALARAAGRVLHEEHIELLGAAASALRGRLRPADVTAAQVVFEAPGPEAPGATLALANLARLHRLVDVAGPVREIVAIRPSPGRLGAELRLRTGAIATLDFRRGPGLTRQTRLRLETSAGVYTQVNDALWIDGTPLGLDKPECGLFALDHALAKAEIAGAPATVGDDRVVHVLDVADRLGAGCNGLVH